MRIQAKIRVPKAPEIAKQFKKSYTQITSKAHTFTIFAEN